MADKKFKTTLFGGFDRSDVIAYIEQAGKSSMDRISALEHEVSELQKSGEALRGDLASVTGARDRLSDALHDNFDKQEELRAALDSANTELETLRARLEALSAERDALRTEVETLRPQAEEFASVKSNIAGLELAARRRADDYEAETRRQADIYQAETRAQLNDLIGACRQQCEQMITMLSDSCASISKELHRTDSAVSRLPAVFDMLQNGLDGLKNV